MRARLWFPPKYSASSRPLRKTCCDAVTDGGLISPEEGRARIAALATAVSGSEEAGVRLEGGGEEGGEEEEGGLPKVKLEVAWRATPSHVPMLVSLWHQRPVNASAR